MYYENGRIVSDYFALDFDTYLSTINKNTETIYMFSYHTEIHHQAVDMISLNNNY